MSSGTSMNVIISAATIPDASWWVVFNGSEFGPVSTDAISQMCGDGVVRDDTPVRSTLFRHRVKAADVPALRPQISPITADAKVAEAMLRGIPSKKLGVRWYQFYPLDPTASAWAVLILLAGAALAAFARFTDIPLEGGGTDARLGRATGAVVWTFLLPLLAGWACAAVAWRAKRENRLAAMTGFWLGAGPVLCAMLCAPLLERQRGADARGAERQRDDRERAAVNVDARAPIDAKPGVPRTVAPLPTPTTAPGDSDELRLNRVARWAVPESTEAYLRYDAAIRALNINEVWQPARLVDPATYPDALRKCDAVRTALRDLGEQIERVHAGVTARAAASGASERARERALADYAVHRNDARAAYRAFAAEERRLLLEVESLLEFLQERSGNGSMALRGGRLLFRDRADAEAFNERARRLGAVAAERAQRVAANRNGMSKELGGQSPAADAR